MKRIYIEYLCKLERNILKQKNKVLPPKESVNYKGKKIIVIDQDEFNIDEDTLSLNEHYRLILKTSLEDEMNPDIIAWLGNVEKSRLMKMPNLRWLQIPSVGWNTYDNDALYANYEKVALTNLKGVFDIPIAEYCCATVLMMSRKAICLNLLPWMAYPRNEGCFKDVESSKVLIIGAGAIGTEIARKLRGIGIDKVYGVKRHIASNDAFDEIIGMNEVKDYVNEVDFVISALPETEETTDIFDSEFFEKMKSTAYFINVGRGNAVNERDLRKALRKRKFAGAILDVTKHERKLPFTLLDWTPGVVLTRHRSSLSLNNQKRKDKFVKSQLERFLGGEDLCNRKL